MRWPVAIGPARRSPETLDQQLLELDGMPTSYRLFRRGRRGQMLPRGGDGRRDSARISGAGASRPLRTLRERRERRETTTIYVVLQPVDARRVYWSFFEGLDGILIPPP
jgi:hypothetical protein